MDNEGFRKRVIAAVPEHEKLFEQAEPSFDDQTPTFYHGVQVTRGLLATDIQPNCLYYAHNSGTFFYLDGTADTIYAANDLAGLRLTLDDVSAYVRFFFQISGGGELAIVESPDELTWAIAEQPARYGSLIQPIEYRERTGPVYQVRFCGIWQQVLVQMAVEFTADGRILRHTQQPLATDVVACLNEAAILPDPEE